MNTDNRSCVVLEVFIQKEFKICKNYLKIIFFILNNYKTLCFFQIRQKASKGAKMRRFTPFGAMRATFAVLGQAEFFRCINFFKN
jgi:hypothetical protein